MRGKVALQSLADSCRVTKQPPPRTCEQSRLPWVPTHRQTPSSTPARHATVFFPQGHGRPIGRIALVVDGSRTGPRAHPAKCAWDETLVQWTGAMPSLPPPAG